MGLAHLELTGNPIEELQKRFQGLPKWNPYTPSERATMIFGNECRVGNDPNREERLAFQNPGRPSAA